MSYLQSLTVLNILVTNSVLNTWQEVCCTWGAVAHMFLVAPPATAPRAGITPGHLVSSLVRKS